MKVNITAVKLIQKESFPPRVPRGTTPEKSMSNNIVTNASFVILHVMTKK